MKRPLLAAHEPTGRALILIAVPVFMKRRRLVAEGVRVLSQLRVSYRGSPLSVEGTPRPDGRLHAVDRLPDQTVTCAGRTVRPDGHVGLRCGIAEPDQLTAWLNLIRTPGSPADPGAA